MKLLSRAGCLIAAASLTGAAAFSLSAATATAAATGPQHVAIVVRFGPGQVEVGCSKHESSGLADLEDVFKVLVGQPPSYAGFVLQINNYGTLRPDDTHYWSYWHAEGSEWDYSSTGAAGYTPKAGAVEGWSYVDGENGARSAPPPTGPPLSYAALCANKDPHPTPKPSPPHATVTRTANATAAHSSTAHSSATASAHVSATAASRTATKPATTRPDARVPASAAAPTASDSPAEPGIASARASGSGSALPAGLRAAPPVPRSSPSAWPTWGTALAALAVAALGGLAYWRMRPRRG